MERMEEKRKNIPMGLQSLKFGAGIHILEGASVVGKKEGEGPLGALFDEVLEDPYFGGNCWEEAEANLQRRTAKRAIEKAGLKKEDIRYIFSGDLLNQLIATSFGLEELSIPLFGLYGACSTMGEALSLAAIAMSADCGDYCIAMASSHFGSAEKNYRFPLEYGNQRPLSSTWTVTGSGSVILGKCGGFARITGITTGKVTDLGCKDSMNMGAAMAPAAANVIYQNLADFGYEPEEYDRIITGDLGSVGQNILFDLLEAKGKNIRGQHMDCGIEIFSSKKQDTHSGGSGCGCSASVLCSYVFKQLKLKKWKKVLFVPTGALLSTISFNEGMTIPGIAHGVVIEAVN